MGLLPSKTTPPPNGTTPSPPTPPNGTTPSPPTPPNGTTPSPPTPPNGTTPSPPTPPNDTTPSPPTPPNGGTTPSPPTPPNGTTPSPPTPPNVTTPSPPTPPNGMTPSPPTSPNGTTSPPPTPPVVTTPSPSQQPPTVAAAPSPPPPPVGNVLPLLANGQYAVGCADIMLPEPSAASTSSADGVGLFARLFYPAASSVVLPCMRWRPPDTEYIVGLAKSAGRSELMLNLFFYWVVGDKKSPVHWHAPVVPGEQRFPLVIFSHGISGSRFVYTTVCASLASHGYVVAALEHRDGSCCWTYTLEPAPQQNEEGKPCPKMKKTPIEMSKIPAHQTEPGVYSMASAKVKRRVAEIVHMRQVLAEMDANLLQNATTDNNSDRQFGQQQILLGQKFDWTQFKNRLALDRCVCMGHSFGGASSLSACAEYPSLFNACVLLDAWLYPVERRMYTATVQPVLMLNASKWQSPHNVRRMQRLLDKATNDNETPPTATTTTTAPQQQSQDGTATTANGAPSVINTDSRMMFTIKDIVHQSFSDFGFLVPGFVARYIGFQGDLDPLLTGTAVFEMILQFLESQFLHQQQQKEDDEVARSNASALDRLRRLVAEKYATFVVEGTDISQVKLDEVGPLVEAEQQQAVAAEEERRVANDTPPTTETTAEEAAENNNQPSS